MNKRRDLTTTHLLRSQGAGTPAASAASTARVGVSTTLSVGLPSSGAILAISGSRRRDSINSAVLRAAAAAAADDGVRVEVDDDSVGRLPQFDPDLEQRVPEVVARFRAACEAAAGLLIAVPEYAFGIPGSFKNALDWTVGSGSLYRKRITVLNVASPGRGLRVLEALDHVFSALDADIVHHSVPVGGRDREPSGEISGSTIIDELRAVVAELASRAAAEAGLRPR